MVMSRRSTAMGPCSPSLRVALLKRVLGSATEPCRRAAQPDACLRHGTARAHHNVDASAQHFVQERLAEAMVDGQAVAAERRRHARRRLH